MGLMSAMVSLRPSSKNHLKESSWMEIRSGTSRICDSLEKDVRGLGVVLWLKRAHSSRGLTGLHGLMAQTRILSCFLQCQQGAAPQEFVTTAPRSRWHTPA